MDKILFVIPTLFNNPERVKKCVYSLIDTVESDFDIVVVSNTENEEFTNWKCPEEVTKKVSGLKYNIAKAINTGFEELTDHKYLCYVDEGLVFENSQWLKDISYFYKTFPNCGVIGIRGHSTFARYHRRINDEFYKVLWTDGIMFMTPDRFKKMEGFDESYFGDCETQDFCYRLVEKNYNNFLYKTDKIHHEITHFEKKDSNSEFLDIVLESRKRFLEKWEDWRNSKYIF